MRNLLILLVILGSLSVIVGLVFKLMNWPLGNLFIGAGLITEVFSALALLVRSLKNRNRSQKSN